MSDPVVFNSDAADRIAKVVREAERAAGRQRHRAKPPAIPQEKTKVEVTAQHDAYPMYEGTVYVFDSSTRTNAEYGECYLIEASRRELVEGVRYQARRVGDYGGKPLFETQCCGDEPAPPDPTCDYCDGETPVAWDLTLEGFTGDCESVNGEYQLDWTEEGCEWLYEDETLSILLVATETEYVLNITVFGEPDAEIVYTKVRTSPRCCGPVALTLGSSDCEGAPEDAQILAPACEAPEDCAWCINDPSGDREGPIVVLDDLPDTLYFHSCFTFNLPTDCNGLTRGPIPLTRSEESNCLWTGSAGYTGNSPDLCDCGILIKLTIHNYHCFKIDIRTFGHDVSFFYSCWQHVHNGYDNGLPLFGWFSPAPWAAPPSQYFGTLELNPFKATWLSVFNSESGAEPEPLYIVSAEPLESLNCCQFCDGDEQMWDWQIDPNWDESNEWSLLSVLRGLNMSWVGSNGSFGSLMAAGGGCLWSSNLGPTSYYGAQVLASSDGYLYFHIWMLGGSNPYATYRSIEPFDNSCCVSGSIDFERTSNTFPPGVDVPESVTVFRGFCNDGVSPPPPPPSPCTSCTGTTPATWSIAFEGLYCESLNGTHTLTSSSACVWTTTVGDFTLTFTLGETTITLSITDGDSNTGEWSASTQSDCCESLTLTQSSGTGCLDGVGNLVTISSCYEPPPPPPGDCEDCEETPTEWTAEISGFTGDYSDYNGTWTFAQDSDCTWSGSLNGKSMGVSIAFSSPTTYLTLASIGDSLTVTYRVELTDCCDVHVVEELTLSGGTGDGPEDITLTPDCYVPEADTCNDCTGTTPLTWTAEITGFEDGCEAYNGSWTLTQSESLPCTWIGSLNGKQLRLEIMGDSASLADHPWNTEIGYYDMSGPYSCESNITVNQGFLACGMTAPYSITLVPGGA